MCCWLTSSDAPVYTCWINKANQRRHPDIHELILVTPRNSIHAQAWCAFQLAPHSAATRERDRGFLPKDRGTGEQSLCVWTGARQQRQNQVTLSHIHLSASVCLPAPAQRELSSGLCGGISRYRVERKRGGNGRACKRESCSMRLVGTERDTLSNALWCMA